MSGRHVLFVDDDPDDVQLTLLGFARAGLTREVVVARDGVEALDLLRREQSEGRPLPAAVLTDLKMPRMDGIELLQSLQAERALRGIPVLVFTSSGDETDKKTAFRLGACRYMRKPSDLDDYAEIVREIERAAAGEVPEPGGG